VSTFDALVLAELLLAPPTFVALLLVAAPYGRHARAGWGPALPARAGWLLMESPAVVAFGAAWAAGPHRAGTAALALLALWELHYLYRSLVYPALLRPGSRMPASVVAMAIAFNVLNGGINGWWISHRAYPAGWVSGPRFLLGAALFAGGLALNAWSDRALRRLRAPGNTGYAIPRGGPFDLVSCPNYLGEIVEWTGWAIAAWSPAGAAFAIYTVANLLPRAVAHHAWYRRRFPDYPRARRALVPFVL